MFVYNPKTLYDVWPAFYAFVDFLIRMINENKIKVTKTNEFSGMQRPTSFHIWLSESRDIKEELKITFEYEPSGGIFLGTIMPIRRFRFSLVKSVGVLFDAESRDPKSYDKMLELFKAVVAYAERHDKQWHERILKNVDLASLERSSWKKSRKDIEKELNEKWETRKAAEDFDRQRTGELSKLTSDYKSQGYEITD